MAKTFFNFQLEEEEKALIEAAAKKEKRSMSAFVLFAALERAKELYGMTPEDFQKDGEDCGQSEE